MIYLFSGTPGSGKSLDVARCILNDLKFSHPVICNFPISIPKALKKKENLFHFWKNDNLHPSDLVRFSSEYFKSHKFKEGSISLYIDECQLLFNARTWNEKGRSDWIAFFSNHRHFGFDIVLVCQFDRMIDRQIRSLIEIEVIHRKLNQIGLKGLFFRILFLSPTLFIKISMYYPLKERTSVSFYRYSSRFASIYDSYTSVFINDIYNKELQINCTSGGATEERKEVPPEVQPNCIKPDISIIEKIALISIIIMAKIY